MKQDIVVPRMGESISEAIIGTILKPSDSYAKVDDEILELETDKVNQVLYAPVAGKVTLSVKSGDTVKIGQVVGTVESDDVQMSPAKSETPAAPKEEAPAKSETPAAQKEEAPPKKEVPITQSTSSRQGKEAFLQEFKRSEPIKEIATVSHQASSRSETRKKLPKIRRVIAERLLEAQNSAVMLTTFNEVDMTEVMALRERYKENFMNEFNVKLGFMSFFVHAAVSALRSFPEVNAYLEGDELVYRNYFDIGIAVSTDRGLLVPVLRDCDKMNFAQIEQSLENFAKQSREGNINVDDLKGGGFTITNGGVFGSLLSTPILNPPQVAILGMHKILKRPIALNDQVVIRPMMYLALTYDHRVLDGREAVSFLVHIKQSLEDPARQLLDM